MKICGITNLQDAINAVEAGADAVGFVFFKKSKRFIEPSQARVITSQLPPFVYKVGVFVNEEPDVILETVRKVGLTAVQLHGDEPPHLCDYLGRFVEVIKSFRIAEGKDVEAFFSYQGIVPLFDTKVPEYGGSGKTFDWLLLKPFASRLKYFILSGGLNPQNVKEAVATLAPYAVDVSSGVEIHPGKKDPEKMRSFVENAKGL
ncbi:MAG: phosphoribosylanthranilate isomerase [Thermotogota bacterium]|nr:phosphoribosylanthranilate isomerase [Thermotogota bacterium]MDK2864414.1 phosphoribosylanthranilate isomerase [Thermotogota bacterium]